MTSNIAFLLLLAENDEESAQVLDVLDKSGIRGITPIVISDRQSLNKIKYNTMGVQVTQLPSIIIAQNGLQTQVYPGSAINTVIDMVKSITMNQEITL